jgi:putative DNA primase/helicase
MTLASLFHRLYCSKLCYVREAKSWYAHDGRVWKKDIQSLVASECCKQFVDVLLQYAQEQKNKASKNLEKLGGSSKNEELAELKKFTEFEEYALYLQKRSRRNSLLLDAKSIAPISTEAFDRDKYLLNCANGTLNLLTGRLQPHNPHDYITKIALVEYNRDAKCERWEQFIHEVMCGDADVSKFLQKSLGYSLSGDTSFECFFILLGELTRNGKSTTTETVAHLLHDYAESIQPQTLSHRSSNGASASPDIAKLRGARFVCAAEPSKNMELNVALVKQLTGGDTYTGRMLFENQINFKPEFKIFFNTNPKLKISDDTLFKSDRVKVIPFDRHFTREEQDKNLKDFFRKPENMSGILNWLLEGYRLLQNEGLDMPEKVASAISNYNKDPKVEALSMGVEAELRNLLLNEADIIYNIRKDKSDIGNKMFSLEHMINFMGILYVRGGHIKSCNFGGRANEDVKKHLVNKGALLLDDKHVELSRGLKNYRHRVLLQGYDFHVYAFDIETLMGEDEATEV